MLGTAPDGEQHVRGIEAAGGTSGTGGGQNSGVCQIQHEALTLHAGDGDVEIIGKSPGRIAIEEQIGNGGLELLQEIVAELGQPV